MALYMMVNGMRIKNVAKARCSSQMDHSMTASGRAIRCMDMGFTYHAQGIDMKAISLTALRMDMARFNTIMGTCIPVSGDMILYGVKVNSNSEMEITMMEHLLTDSLKALAQCSSSASVLTKVVLLVAILKVLANL